jgi:hypothetical protein
MTENLQKGHEITIGNLENMAAHVDQLKKTISENQLIQ